MNDAPDSNMTCEIVDRYETLHLVHGKGRGWAVVEIRNDQALSMEGSHRREAEADEAGIIEVVGSDGWQEESEARTLFRDLAKTGERLSRNML